MKIPRYIAQENPTGCGYACVSMLTNPPKSYIDIKIAGKVAGQTRDLYTDKLTIKKLLKQHGVKVAGKFQSVKGKKWHDIKFLALVACGLRANGNWHWVVYDGRRGLVFDPSSKRKGPFTPNGTNRKPHSALEILS